MNGPYSIEGCGWASAQSGELREDEPDPVALFPSGLQFRQRSFERTLLGIDEALQLKRIPALNHK
jgi:hypothetical protein